DLMTGPASSGGARSLLQALWEKSSPLSAHALWHKCVLRYLVGAKEMLALVRYLKRRYQEKVKEAKAGKAIERDSFRRWTPKPGHSCRFHPLGPDLESSWSPELNQEGAMCNRAVASGAAIPSRPI